MLILKLLLIWIVDMILRFPTQMDLLASNGWPCNFLAIPQFFTQYKNSCAQLHAILHNSSQRNSNWKLYAIQFLITNLFIVYLKIWKESLLKEQLISWWTADANFTMELCGTMARYPTFKKTFLYLFAPITIEKNDSKGLNFMWDQTWHVGGGGSVN